MGQISETGDRDSLMAWLIFSHDDQRPLIAGPAYLYRVTSSLTVEIKTCTRSFATWCEQVERPPLTVPLIRESITLTFRLRTKRSSLSASTSSVAATERRLETWLLCFRLGGRRVERLEDTPSGGWLLPFKSSSVGRPLLGDEPCSFLLLHVFIPFVSVSIFRIRCFSTLYVDVKVIPFHFPCQQLWSFIRFEHV